MIQMVKIEDLARSVIFSDRGAEFSMLDVMRILEISLRATLGVNCLIDGAMEIDLANGHMLHCTLRKVASS